MLTPAPIRQQSPCLHSHVHIMGITHPLIVPLKPAHDACSSHSCSTTHMEQRSMWGGTCGRRPVLAASSASPYSSASCRHSPLDTPYPCLRPQATAAAAAATAAAAAAAAALAVLCVSAGGLWAGVCGTWMAHVHTAYAVDSTLAHAKRKAAIGQKIMAWCAQTTRGPAVVQTTT
jgi:hypothetical protein